jgi:DNA-binding transcriptional regulator/RsmH inhibitor MraZ
LTLEDHLVLMPCEVWDEYLEELRASLVKIACEDFVKELIRNSELVIMATKRRVPLPLRLVEAVGLKDEALLFPVPPKIEIWNPERYAKHRENVVAIFKEKIGFPMISQNHTPTA